MYTIIFSGIVIVWAGPCGAPGHGSLSVSPVSCLQGIDFSLHDVPGVPKSRFKQLLSRKRGCRDEGGAMTARRSNQSILKEINPDYLLEELMLKLKLQYSGHLMQRADSLEKTLMLGKSEGRRRRGQQSMRWLGGISDSMHMSLRSWRTGQPGVLQSMGVQRVGHDWVNEQQHGCLCAQLLSHVRHFAVPWTVARQAPLLVGFPRQEYWSGLPLPTPGDLPDPGIKHMSPALVGGFFTTAPPGKP